ncbi:MAG: DUF4132 domain-containing protein [Myxococcales bacterium]|nr:DUF4132 domain-containing protein [Myxococcales bacterium]
MLDDPRLARLLTRGRYVMLDEPALAQLVEGLRGGDPALTEAPLAALDKALDPRAVGALLASALSAGEAPDGLDRGSVVAACRSPARLNSFLAKVSPDLPWWEALLGVVEGAGGVDPRQLDGSLLGLATAWVFADEGRVSSLGAAVLTRAEGRLDGLLEAMLHRGEGELATGAEVLRAELMGLAARDRAPRRALLEAMVAKAPAGERGGLAVLWWELSDEAGPTVRTLAEGRASRDRDVALEALLRRSPGSALELARRVVRTEPVPPPPHDRLPIQAVAVSALGAGDPIRWADALGGVIRQVQGPWALEALGRLPFQLARPHLVWMATHTPGHMGLVAMERALGTPWEGRVALALSALARQDRELAATVVKAAMGFSAQERAGFGVLLDHGEVALRLAATELLNGVEDVEIKALIEERLTRERSPRVRAQLMARLGRAEATTAEATGAPADDDPRRAVEASLEAVARSRPRGMLSWYAANKASALVWDDGAPLTAHAGVALLRWQIESGSLAPTEAVIDLVAQLDAESVRRWATSALRLWVAAGAPARDHAVLSLAVALAEDAVFEVFAAALEGWSRGRAGLIAEVVALSVALGSPAALRFVDHVAAAHEGDSIGQHAGAVLEAEAALAGRPLEVLLDEAVPTLGLEIEGGARWSVGSRQYTVALEGWQPVLCDAIGRRHTAPPKPGRGGDAAQFAAVTARWRALEQGLEAVVARETERLWEHFRQGRVWEGRDWHAHFYRNPLLRRLARGLVWQHASAGLFRVGLDGTLSDVEGLTVYASALEEGTLWLAHPTGLDPADRAAWQRRQREARLDGLIDAIDRRDLSAHSVVGRSLRGFAAGTHRDRQPWQRVAGWHPLPTEGGLCKGFVRHHRQLKIDAVLRVEGIALWAESDRSTRVTEVVFMREGQAVEPGPRLRSEVNLDLEAMLDVDAPEAQPAE